MTTEFNVGDRIVLTAIFEVEGVPTNPTSVYIYIKNPKGEVTTLTGGSLTNPSTGVFKGEVTLNRGGRWSYAVRGTGAVISGTADIPIIVTQTDFTTYPPA